MTPQTQNPPTPQPAPTSSTLEVVVAAFTGLGYALSARALLLFSLIGSFVLALEAMREQTNASLLVLIAFVIGAVFPATFLEVRRRSS